MQMQMQMSLATTINQQLSQDLIQHLGILQLSSIELTMLIKEKALENPLIEIEEGEIEKPYDWLKQATLKTAKGSTEIPDVLISSSSLDESFLYEQIPFTLTKEQRKIIHFLIDCLDERLFLTLTIHEVASKLGESIKDVEEMYTLLQTFEPLGIGASNVQQFLQLHIADDFHAPHYAATFVEHEMKAVAKMDVTQLEKKYKLSNEEVRETIDYIKKLPRSPARSLQELSPFIIPDMTISFIDGHWLIDVNDRLSPQISLNGLYVELLRNTEDEYLQKSMKDYLTLVQGIDFRKKTMYAIVDYIVENQEAFLREGQQSLQPMGIKDIAIALDLHESTISRAIKGKYIETPKGIFSVRQLFVKAVSNVTATTVQEHIQFMINNELKSAPLSDQQIAENLLKEGMKLSRRTVAKYREQMFIPNSKNRLVIQ